VKRILAIDYGTKKTGIAVSDPLQLIANGLETIPTIELFNFLEEYFQQEEVEAIVVGEPFFLDGKPAQHHTEVLDFVEKLKLKFPNLPVHLQDETNTSLRAKEIILKSGARKKKRRDKTLVDKISAVLILQDWLENKRTL